MGLATGYFQYYAVYIRCGKEPVIVPPGSSFASGYGPGYYTKEDGFNYKPAWDRSYYCSEKDAQKAGIEPGVFSRKHLREEGIE